MGTRARATKCRICHVFLWCRRAAESMPPKYQPPGGHGVCPSRGRVQEDTNDRKGHVFFMVSPHLSHKSYMSHSPIAYCYLSPKFTTHALLTFTPTSNLIRCLFLFFIFDFLFPNHDYMFFRCPFADLARTVVRPSCSLLQIRNPRARNNLQLYCHLLQPFARNTYNMKYHIFFIDAVTCSAARPELQPSPEARSNPNHFDSSSPPN